MEKKMHVVTIVIPAYNSEKYIEKCLDSVVNQTFDDYEVLIVNDGSTDDTEEILEMYRTRYPELIRVYKKQNGGLSSARNYGMEKVNSKYIIFLDSDDYLDSVYVETLVREAEEKKADVVCSGQYRVTEENHVVSHVKYQLDSEGKCILRHLNMHGKLYRMDYIREHKVVFPEGKLYEDNSFNIVLFFMTERISFLNYEGYYQLVHLNSITTRKILEENVPFKELEDATKYVVQNRNLINDYDVFEYTLMSFFTYFILEANKKHRLYKLEDRKSDWILIDKLCDFAKRLLEQNCVNYYKNKYLNFFRKSDVGIKQKVGVFVFIKLLHIGQLKRFVRLYYKF